MTSRSGRGIEGSETVRLCGIRRVEITSVCYTISEYKIRKI